MPHGQFGIPTDLSFTKKTNLLGNHTINIFKKLIKNTSVGSLKYNTLCAGRASIYRCPGSAWA